MGLTNAFYEAVQSGNVLRVRIMMEDSLLVDPTFAEFEAMEKAASSMQELYDEHDGKEFIEDRNLWNDDYMDKVMVKVLSNFSHERIDHLKEVVRYLRPVTKTVVVEQKQTNHHNHTARQSCYGQEHGDFPVAKIGAGTVAGAAVGGVIASVAGAPVAGVIGGIAAGAIVGGATTAIIVNRGKR